VLSSAGYVPFPPSERYNQIVRPNNTDEDLGSATGLPPFDGRLSSNNPNTDVLGDNVEGQTETQEVRNQEDEPEVRDHTESREPNTCRGS
jgi:hypothetical protein